MKYIHWLAIGVALMFATPAVSQEIPLADFFKHAEFGDVAISPDGRYLAVSVPEEDRRNLAIIDITEPGQLKITAGFKMRGGESPIGVHWVTNERLIFQSMLEVGALERPQPTGRVFAINADGSNRRQLFGTQAGSMVGRTMSIVSYLASEPDWVLIQHWAHDRPKPIAQRMHIDDGRLGKRISSPLNQGGLLADQNDQVRFAYGSDDDGIPQFSWRPNEDSKWRTFKNDFGTYISPIAFNPDGSGVYFSSQEIGKLGVYEITLATGEVTPVLQSERVEVDTMGGNPYVWDASASNLLAARFMDGKPEWRSVQEDAFEIKWLRQLEAMYDGFYVNIFNWTADGKRALLSVSGDVAEPEYFLLDTETPELRFIASAKPWLDPSQMAPMQPISFEARDGLELHGYLTMPLEHTADKPSPFVVYVHGGPHGPRDRWGFDRMAQLFAYHGFGVLQINYRGSGGYSRAFEEMGYGEWHGKMQDDITDGTLWAMEQGFADKERTCIAGASYGGFATLSGITREPELYACAWAFVGVYDLPLMKEEGNIPSFEAGRRYLDRVLGTDKDVLLARSPSNHVEKIITPLFISHGAEDKQAHFGQYHLLRERLDQANVPYEHMFVEGEGHGFYKVENNVAMMERVLAFMKKHTE